MKSIKSLKEERSALHEKMHDLVQAAEQRSDAAFTPEEKTQYEEYRAQYDTLSERIARLEADEQRAAEQARPLSAGIGKAPETEETRGEKRNEELRSAFFDLLSGRKTRNDLPQEVRDGLFLGASNNQIVVPKLVMSKVTMALKSTGTFLDAIDFVITETSDSYVLPTYDATGDELVRVKEGGKTTDKATFEALCEHASEREVIAAEAERASIKYKMVEFMQARLGEEFAGHISGITEWGIFVEIDENHIEGLVAMRDMHDDFYDFDPAEYTVTGRSTGRRFTLGDAVRIRVKRADLQKRQLDFDMVLPDAPRTDTPQRGRRSPQVKRRR